MRGPLNVGCLVTFAQIVMPRVRRGFVDRFPSVEFRQYERDQAELFDALRSARIDVALTYDLNITDDFEFLPLIDLPPFVLLGDVHPLAGWSSVTPRDLAEYPMVLLDLPISADYFLSFFPRTGVAPRVIERTRDMAVVRSLVANGFGYSVADIGAAHRTPRTGRSSASSRWWDPFGRWSSGCCSRKAREVCARSGPSPITREFRAVAQPRGGRPLSNGWVQQPQAARADRKHPTRRSRIPLLRPA